MALSCKLKLLRSFQGIKNKNCNLKFSLKNLILPQYYFEKSGDLDHFLNVLFFVSVLSVPPWLDKLTIL